MTKKWTSYIFDASGKIVWAESWATGLGLPCTCAKPKPTPPVQ